MKWKSILLALFASAGFMLSSCSDDNNEKIDGPDTEVEGEKGFFSFTTSTHPRTFSGSNTRTVTEEGEAEEGIVKSGFVALYNVDAAGKPTTVAHRFDLDIDNSGGNGFEFDATNDVAEDPNLPNNKSRFTMKAKEVEEKNDYLMLVALNPTSQMVTAAAKGNPYTAFETAESKAAEDFAKGNTDNQLYSEIAMTNGRGLVEIQKTQFYETEEKAEKASNIPVVGVDRVLAKVKFARSATLQIIPDDATFGEAKWALDVTNKWTYWVRKQTKVAPYEGGGLETLRTDREFLYAEDPNWTGYSQRKYDPIPPTDALKAQFNYLTSLTDLDKVLPAAGSSTREYVLENTMDADEQWEDVTTRVLINGNYIPKGMGADESYYFYRGAAFTHEQIYNMVTDAASYPWPEEPKFLEEAVTAIMTSPDNPGFDFNSATEPGTSLADPNNLIHFYKEGKSYYTIRIRHFDDGLSPEKMGFGRYGVVRNNVYNITLTRVSGPGSPIIPDPEGEDDKDSYISAQIDVQPWVVRTQNAEI